MQVSKAKPGDILRRVGFDEDPYIILRLPNDMLMEIWAPGKNIEKYRLESIKSYTNEYMVIGNMFETKHVWEKVWKETA